MQWQAPAREWVGSTLGTLVAAMALALVATEARPEMRTTGPFSYMGMCEASGAVLLPADATGGRSFLVVNDEDNMLRAYPLAHDGPPEPLAGADLNTFLGLDPTDDDDKADLEAAAWLGDRIYILGSHSRSAKGRLRTARHQFFAVTVEPSPSAGYRIVPTSPRPSHALLDALVRLDPRLKAAIRPDWAKEARLAPEASGLNIEALASRPDGRSLLIGLRNPLSDKGEAWVVPFENPADVVGAGATPRLQSPIFLDLGGRGIRSMDYSPADHLYYVVAGPAGSSGSFDLYRWSGVAGEPPTPVQGAAAVIASQPDFQPEAIVVDPAGRALHLLSDDGDRPLGSRQPCKSSRSKSFRSLSIELDAPPGRP